MKSTAAPKILALDTATASCVVAITEGCQDGGKVLGSLLLGGMTHSRRLLRSVEYLMTELDVGWSELDAVAVSLGPGSFTGLRIGLATAKGLAAAAGLPLLGCSTLTTLAYGCFDLAEEGQCVCSILDARKKEVYAGYYRQTKDAMEQEGELLVLSPQKLAEELTGANVLVGDGAVLYRTIFEEMLGGRVRFASAWLNQPSASVLGFLGAAQFQRGTFLDLGSVSPVYVRKSDAELNLAEKAKKKG